MNPDFVDLLRAFGAADVRFRIVGAFLYMTNPPPATPALSAEAVNSGKPFVVKLHAQWCPYCMLTKDVWSQIEDAYAEYAPRSTRP